MGDNGTDSRDLEISLGFTGNAPVKLDSALRLPVPSKFRDVLDRKYPETAGQLVVVPDNGKLKMLPLPVWRKVEAQLESLSEFDPNGDDLKTFIFGNMTVCSLDAQNRIKLTPDLCEMADIEKEVVVVGQQDRMEIWNAAKWKEFNAGTGKNLKALMSEVFKNRQSVIAGKLNG